MLRGIERSLARVELGLDAGRLPFCGEDVWNAYELSWLARSGQPRVGTAVLRVPCSSPRVVESKSLKLYLASLNQERLGPVDDLARCVRDDVAAVVGAPVELSIREGADGPSRPEACERAPALSLDALDVPVECAGLDPEGLRSAGDGSVEEALETHAFRSLCPVTEQPDWASVRIEYRGRPIDRAALLRYLVSYRVHREFHECCAERIFWDVWRRCAPERLSVQARFTRRGGIDINPFRSSEPARAPNLRTGRQ